VDLESALRLHDVNARPKDAAAIPEESVEHQKIALI
jgi:hypothetical protein